ncbi:uncharacterized protein LOC113167228 [Anabas testudineus]|uniref:uncharacterized protein LOC113167228 n=1 Tax=Anabas testudineus TaxID=64144 RepID=UPI000E45CDFC|nr:uncharacterized protein LOC113167228 [Anabas testudineus]
MGVDEQMVGLSRVGVFEGGTVSYREVKSSWFDSEQGREAALNHQRVNMNMYPILICFLLTLQDGNTGLSSAEKLHIETEGGNITVGCSFYLSGSRKLFCKEECTTGNILIETTNDRAQRDRYSIEYKEGSNIMYVSITQLKKSDSGWYTCNLERLGPDGYEKFELLVTEASTTLKPNFTLRPSTTSSSSWFTKTTQTSVFSSERFTSSSASTETTKHPETESPAGSGTLLYCSLSLVFIIIILLVTVLIFCMKRPKKLKEHPVEAEDTHAREVSQVYEEIREEDRQSRSSPVEVSTGYNCAKYTKPNGVDTTDEYSVATDPPACAQNQKLIYTDVDFPDGTTNSLNSASCGSTDNVMYAGLPQEESSADHINDASPPLYSTVDLHQE